MNWQLHVQSAEAMLNDPSVPSSLDIINLIKKVNPTSLCLSDRERTRGYEIKGRLQNLLLENYGEAFHLAPHPYSDRYVLIKHCVLPSIDACHAEVASLSRRALESVADSPVKPREKKAKRHRIPAASKDEADGMPKDALKKAQELLEQYDYAGAAEVLADIRAEGADDLATLVKATRILVEEMGAYERAMETLLAQPKQVLRERAIRELLALTCYHNGRLPEARAVFDSLHPEELGKDALCAWADIALRDDNISHAGQLLRAAQEKEGFVASFAGLQKEIGERLLSAAAPLLQRALAARERGELDEAAELARQALRLCPGHEQARDIVSLREAGREAAEIAALWEQFGCAQRGEARLELLTRLLEKDRENRAQIEGLIGAEKARRKKQWGDRRLQELRTLAREEKWRECYDIICWLSRQDDLAAEYRLACDLSPHFALLYQNRALQKLPERTAKECWLQSVEARAALKSGQLEASLEIMERIKGYFHAYPEFAEEYRALLRGERQRAREEIGHLLELLNGDGCTLAQGERIAGQIRKKMAVLPEEERRGHQETTEARLALLRPVQSDAALLRQYKHARYLGFDEKCALLREQIADKVALARIDAKCARVMTVEAEPLTLTVNRDVSRAKLLQKPNIWLHWQTDRHIVLVDGHWRIVVNLEEMSATRYRFPYIVKARFCDALPNRNTFLVRDARWTGRGVWRADLSGGKGEVTAVIDAVFMDQERECMAVETFLCSERMTDYYALMAGRGPTVRAVRQRMTTRKPAGDGVEIDGEARPYFRRLTSEPDRFIVGWRDETRICNKNLTTESAVEMPPVIWEIDPVNERIYYFYSHLMKKVDFRFDHYEEFPRSQYSFIFKDHHRIMGICPETDIMMVGMCEKAAFYDFRNHRISEPFRFSRVICTRPARRWYCFDYDADAATLALTDITDAIGSLLSWREGIELLEGDDPQDKNDRYLRAHEDMYFGYQPGRRLPRKGPKPSKQNHRWLYGDEPGCRRPEFIIRPQLSWTPHSQRYLGKRRAVYMMAELRQHRAAAAALRPKRYADLRPRPACRQPGGGGGAGYAVRRGAAPCPAAQTGWQAAAAAAAAKMKGEEMRMPILTGRRGLRSRRRTRCGAGVV
ncbi:MAG TPA: hypothetical protein VJ550_13810 [Geomonas sp.]|nr:hypothetical protein [Geomonas sp.]